MTRCRFCGIYYRCSTAEDYCSALCREKDENKRLKLMFDIKHTGSEANMMDARKKIEELKSQLKEITDVKNALLEGEVLDGKEIEELKSQLELAIGYIESYGLLTLFLKEKEMEGPE